MTELEELKIFKRIITREFLKTSTKANSFSKNKKFKKAYEKWTTRSYQLMGYLENVERHVSFLQKNSASESKN